MFSTRHPCCLNAIPSISSLFFKGKALDSTPKQIGIRVQILRSGYWGNGSSGKVFHGASSSLSSGYGVERSEQQLVGTSSTRTESWSPKSTATNTGRPPVLEKRSGRAESSGSKSEESKPQPLIVKRRTKLPVNWNGAAGTVMLVDKPQGT